MASIDPVPASLGSILITDELERRPSRKPNYKKESRALIALMQSLSDSPETILQKLADTILEVCGCGSAGVSLLTTHDGGKRFYWPAIAGTWKAHIGGGTPRDFGPCGDVLDRNTPLLFKHVERRYTYFQPVTPLVEEALLIPFYVGGKAVGTIWAVAHDPSRKFDAEDKRQLLSLGQFASAAYQATAFTGASRQLASIVESSDDAIVSKMLDGVIISWNKSAERMFGYTAEEAIGKNITLIIPPDRLDEEKTIVEQLRRGERVDHFETVRLRKDGTPLDISLTISPVRDAIGRVIGASKVARDITERKRAEENRKESELSARRMQAQDAERRRLARELHDGVGQLLAAISMNISQVAREKDRLSPEQTRCVNENQKLIDEASREIRTVSYLLHPPLLDEIGLQSALPWYIDGFSERSKIKVTLNMDSNMNRLPKDHELSLFRIVQECLTNIHRHSGSSTASVRLSRSIGKIELEVADEGKGIEKDIREKLNSGASVGVGFRGMQERLKLLGGKLSVRSPGIGASILVSLPIDESQISLPTAKDQNT